MGKNLDFKKDITISLSDGIIIDINFDSIPKDIHEDYIYSEQILFPGFINAHTHIGDYAGLDKSWNISLEDSVGKNGIKYQYMNKSNILDIIKDGYQLLENQGVFGFVDFREQGLEGAFVLNEARSESSFVEGKILARPVGETEDAIKDEVSALVNNGYDIGLNRSFDFSDDTLQFIREITSKNKKIVGVHLGEDSSLDEKSKRKYQKSDFYRTLYFLEPDFIVHGTNLSENQWNELPTDILTVLCPRSNFYFKAGVSPVKFCLQHKKHFALGTDNFMAINPNPIEELQYAIWTNRIPNTYKNFIHLLKGLTTIPSNFFHFNSGVIDIGKQLRCNLFNYQLTEFKYSSWWNNIIFRANANHFSPIVYK